LCQKTGKTQNLYKLRVGWQGSNDHYTILFWVVSASRENRIHTLNSPRAFHFGFEQKWDDLMSCKIAYGKGGGNPSCCAAMGDGAEVTTKSVIQESSRSMVSDHIIINE